MSEDNAEMSGRNLWLITFVAVVAAAVPHFFFAPPLQLHMEGQMQAWLGIAVWAPAMLAGVGFFFGVEFGHRNEAWASSSRARAMDPGRRAAVCVAAVLGYIMFAAVLHIDLWSQMAAMRPTEELQTMLPLFAGLGALRAIFWQGFVQHRVLASESSARRVAVMLVLETLVVSGFLVSADPGVVVGGLFTLVAAEALLGAFTHELGYPVRVSMLLRAIAGLAFVWFQQAALL